MKAEKSSIINEDVWHNRIFTGTWEIATNGHLISLEAATRNNLASIGRAGAEDVVASACSARTVQASWALVEHSERSQIFRVAAELLRSNSLDFVHWLMRESGSVKAKAEFEVGLCITCLLEAAAMPSQTQGIILPSAQGRISLAKRQALGVIGVISPFNFPLYLALRSVAPALTLGNAVVLKPDPRTVVSGGALIACLFKAAGLPAGLLHMLPGQADVGEAMCVDPNIAMIQFTGSSAVGKKIGELAGRHLKKLSLELGGKNSLIILDDADLELAVANVAWASWLHQGQICMSAGRILVHQAISKELTRHLVEKAKSMAVGDPASEAAALGPLIGESQLMHVSEIVATSIAAGAKLEAGGSSEHLYYLPTILSGVKPRMRAFEEEIFGPVAVMTTFDSDDEAVKLANQTDYGLSAGVISRSIARALSIGRRLRTGILHINDQTVRDDVINPFGGVGSSGNGTSIGGVANWEQFTQWQWITIQDAPPAYPM